MDMTPKALQQKIHELEGQMMQHAQNLEFEEAAQIRDQLHQLRGFLSGVLYFLPGGVFPSPWGGEPKEEGSGKKKPPLPYG